MLNIVKALNSTKWGKQKEKVVLHSKLLLSLFLKHHIEIFHIKHQHQETKNYQNTALRIVADRAQHTL